MSYIFHTSTSLFPPAAPKAHHSSGYGEGELVQAKGAGVAAMALTIVQPPLATFWSPLRRPSVVGPPYHSLPSHRSSAPVGVYLDGRPMRVTRLGAGHHTVGEPQPPPLLCDAFPGTDWPFYSPFPPGLSVLIGACPVPPIPPRSSAQAWGPASKAPECSDTNASFQFPPSFSIWIPDTWVCKGN